MKHAKAETNIEEIPSIPPKILEAASSGELVVFIGAGVSRIIGCPSWEMLALKQVEYLYRKGIINYHEYYNLKSLDARKLLSICRNICKKSNTKPPSMESLLKGDKKLIKKFTIFKDLYSFNSIYVTTNYDTFLDEIAQRKIISKRLIKINSKDKPKIEDIEEVYKEKIPSKSKVVFYEKEDVLINNLENGNIIHLHGSTKNEDDVVMTIVDYMNYYKPNQKPAVFLQEVFEKFTVLFVGYGLEEYEIIEFIIRKSTTAKNEIRHFMLYPIFEKDSQLLRFYQEYYGELGIQLIPYSKDKKGYEQLALVINKWAKEIGPISQPRGFYEKIRLIDEVI